MVKFGKTETAKEKVFAVKRSLTIWVVNINNIFISKLIKTKANSKYLIGYLYIHIGPLVLIIPKMS